MKFISKNIFNFYIIFLIVLNILPFVAPIAMHFKLEWLANPIYFIYSFSCHQFYWRSIHFFDYQMAWCTRDTFIWLAFLLVTLGVKFDFLTEKIKIYWLVPFIIPIALDGGIQTLATVLGFSNNYQFYLATNFTRMVTGSLFGMAIGYMIARVLKDEQDVYIEQ